jgi:hypothetical protein
VLGFFIQLPIPKIAAEKLFPLSRFEKEGEGYERFGVKAFKNMLIRSGYNAIMQKSMKVTATSVEEFERLLYLMRQAELIHFFGCVFSIIVSFWFLWSDMFYPFIVIFFSNVLFNVYPILLQRYNRLRIKKIIGKRIR